MIVGATVDTDAGILATAFSLYSRYSLRRVYYSSFSAYPSADTRLPLEPPSLVREHRLDQADWRICRRAPALYFVSGFLDCRVNVFHRRLDRLVGFAGCQVLQIRGGGQFDVGADAIRPAAGLTSRSADEPGMTLR